MSTKRNKNNGRFLKIDPILRFYSHIKKLKNGCWEWSAYKDKDGYGNFSIDRKFTRANRASWLLFIGDIPNGLQVLHKCDNPPCVNPKHLFLGTTQDNTRDRDLKGRLSRGTKVNTNILKKKNALYIRKSKKSSKELSNLFKVSIATIYDIKNKRSWKWI